MNALKHVETLQVCGELLIPGHNSGPAKPAVLLLPPWTKPTKKGSSKSAPRQRLRTSGKHLKTHIAPSKMKYMIISHSNICIIQEWIPMDAKTHCKNGPRDWVKPADVAGISSLAGPVPPILGTKLKAGKIWWQHAAAIVCNIVSWVHLKPRSDDVIDWQEEENIIIYICDRRRGWLKGKKNKKNRPENLYTQLLMSWSLLKLFSDRVPLETNKNAARRGRGWQGEKNIYRSLWSSLHICNNTFKILCRFCTRTRGAVMVVYNPM